MNKDFTPSANMDRRQFIQVSTAAAAAMVLPVQWAQAGPKADVKRWRGFNLLNYFSHWGPFAFREEEFKWIRDWGFNYVRIPLSYWCWTKPGEYFKTDSRVMEDLDRCVEWGRKYDLHVSLNLHRAPGYCINKPEEPQNLFRDAEALEGCAYQWRMLAKRYKGVSHKALSMNLLNEVSGCNEEEYDRVARRLIKEIREESPKRLILLDGMDVGSRPLMTVQDVPRIAQCGRGYHPMLISHYAASWVYGDKPMYFPKENLAWPLEADGRRYDRDFLLNTLKDAWKPWTDKGGLLFVGEFGAHNQTPHEVTLRWLTELLSVFKELGIGWALWNMSGSFGIMDSGRKDVAYEDFHGHKLDRKMLDILQRYG